MAIHNCKNKVEHEERTMQLINSGDEALFTLDDSTKGLVVIGVRGKENIYGSGFLFCPYCGASLGYEPTEADKLLEGMVAEMVKLRDDIEKGWRKV